MPLNYNEVQGIYRNERNTPALQHVGENFYQELAEFLSQLEDEHKSYMDKLIQEIIERRKNKVVMQAMRTDDTSPLNATPEEIHLYTEIVELLGRYKENLNRVVVKEEPKQGQGNVKTLEQEDVRKVQQGGVKEVQEGVRKVQKQDNIKDVPEEDGKTRIRILQALPAIIGADSEHYGPFEEGEETEIPRETAEILIGKGMAEEV